MSEKDNRGLPMGEASAATEITQETRNKPDRNDGIFGLPRGFFRETFGIYSFQNDKKMRNKQTFVGAMNSNDIIALFTIVLAIVGACGVFVSISTLNAIRGQLSAMNRDERPWVSAQISVIDDLRFAPRGFRKTYSATEGLPPSMLQETPQMGVGLHIDLENSGHSPALKTTALVKLMKINKPIMYSPDGGQSFGMKMDDLFQEYVFKCETTANIGGFPLFPGEKSAYIEAEAVTEVHRGEKMSYGFVLIVCVTYLSAVDLESHHTRYVFDLDVTRSHEGNDNIVADRKDINIRPMFGYGLFTKAD